MPPTILIIHPGSLGDVLLSIPAIRSMRKVLPDRSYGLVSSGAVGRLLVACGEIDRLFPLEQQGLTGLLGDGDVPADFREWLSRAELVVGWMNDPDAALASRLQSLGVPRVIIRSPFAVDGQGLHQSDCYHIASGMSPDRSDQRPLRLPQAALEEARARIYGAGMGRRQRMAALHPGSGSPHKCCDPELFRCGIEWLRAHGMVPVLVGGPADDERLAMVVNCCTDAPHTFRGLDLLSMAAVLAQAAQYVGHDSGLTHLAAWLQVPTVAMFGPTDWRRWAPRGPHVEVVCGCPCTCRDWTAVKACRAKPCLQIAANNLADACRKHLPAMARGGS